MTVVACSQSRKDQNKGTQQSTLQRQELERDDDTKIRDRERGREKELGVKQWEETRRA